MTLLYRFLFLLLCGCMPGCSDGADTDSDPGPAPAPDAPVESGYWTDEAAKPGLQVTAPHAVCRLGDEPFRETGVNCYDLFLASIRRSANEFVFDPSVSYEILRVLKEQGVTLVRFSCGPYYAEEVPAYVNHKKRYLATLERIADAAQRLRIGLVPSMIWNYNAFPGYCGEATRSWGREDSRTIALMKEYVGEVVARLSKYKSIYAWEFGNELNLQADLPNWQDAFETSDPAYFFRGDDLRFALSAFAQVVRANDPAGRIIISGHANMRNSQYNQYASGTWHTDSEQQYRLITELFNPDGIQTSEHLYEMSRPFSDLGTVDLTSRIRIAQEAAAALGKIYIVGEFGGADREEYARYYEAMIRCGVPLSFVWNFSIYGNIEHSFIADSEKGRYLFAFIRSANERLRKL